MRLKRIPLRECKYLFLTIWMIIFSTNFALAYDLSKYFPLGQGDTWTYSLIEDDKSSVESIKIDGEEQIGGVKTIKIVDPGGDYACVFIDSDGIKEYKDLDEDTYVIYTPPKPIFSNIEIGMTKGYSTNLNIYKVNNNEEHGGTEIGSIRLESIEEVEVPAGKFNDCLKFSISLENKQDDGSYEKEDYVTWLAQGIGIVKESFIGIECDAKTGKISIYSEILRLISAVINGEKIGDK